MSNLTPQGSAITSQWFMKVGIKPKCPLCDNETFNSSTNTVQGYDYINRLSENGISKTFLHLACKKCNNVLTFDLEAMGLLRPVKD